MRGDEAYDPSLRPLSDLGPASITVKGKPPKMRRCEVAGCGTMLSTALNRTLCADHHRQRQREDEPGLDDMLRRVRRR